MKSIKGRVQRIAIWDLPTRLFHWLLVGLVGLSWWSGKNERLDLHFYSGFAVMTLVLFRILWGLFGSSTARFASFVRGPRAVLSYLRNMRAWRPIGHTPIGALSVLALLSVLLLQVGTGLIQTDDDGLAEGPLAPLVSFDTAEAAHDVHELTFDLLLILIGLHVAAIVLYRLLLGKKLLGPMITGSAALDAETEPMRTGKWWIALLCLVVALATTRWIIAGAPPLGT